MVAVNLHLFIPSGYVLALLILLGLIWAVRHG